jgi:hypothetical protein
VERSVNSIQLPLRINVGQSFILIIIPFPVRAN